jgi:predicted Fe-Mo cluster-binding NifX family protein
MNKRVALAIEEDGKDMKVAGHFGHCSKFLVVELNENNEVVKQESYFNPLAGQHSGSCQVPGYVKQFNVETIIAGGMGQKAVNGFHSFGIEVITASGLMYEEALDLFKKGEISGFEVCAHSQEHGHHHEHNHNHAHHHHNSN